MLNTQAVPAGTIIRVYEINEIVRNLARQKKSYLDMIAGDASYLFLFFYLKLHFYILLFIIIPMYLPIPFK